MLDARRTWTESLSNTYFSLQPNQRIITSDRYVVNSLIGVLSGQIWVGYDRGSLLEGNAQVWLHNTLLGGVYAHKHLAQTDRPNDYHPLNQLAAMGGILAQPLMIITVTRDIHNIGYSVTNAWDYEVLLNMTDDTGQVWYG
jgi:hypothetical protein